MRLKFEVCSFLVAWSY